MGLQLWINTRLLGERYKPITVKRYIVTGNNVNSVTRLCYFKKALQAKFLAKAAQIFAKILGNVENLNIQKKALVANFWATFEKNSASFNRIIWSHWHWITWNSRTSIWTFVGQKVLSHSVRYAVRRMSTCCDNEWMQTFASTNHCLTMNGIVGSRYTNNKSIHKFKWMKS